MLVICYIGACASSATRLRNRAALPVACIGVAAVTGHGARARLRYKPFGRTVLALGLVRSVVGSPRCLSSSALVAVCGGEACRAITTIRQPPAP